MAILQQQRQHGGVGGAAAGGGSKLSPSHLGLPKQPMVDPLPHPGMGSPLSDLHAKTQGMYSGESEEQMICGLRLVILGCQRDMKFMMSANPQIEEI